MVTVNHRHHSLTDFGELKKLAIALDHPLRYSAVLLGRPNFTLHCLVCGVLLKGHEAQDHASSTGHVNVRKVKKCLIT